MSANPVGPAGPTEPAVPPSGAPETSDVAVPLKPAKARYGIVSAAVAVTFALLYAYDLFEAISSMVVINLALGEAGDALGVAVVAPISLQLLLVAAIALPLVVYGVAYVAGLPTRLLGRILIFTTGWAVVNGLTLALSALVAGTASSL